MDRRVLTQYALGTFQVSTESQFQAENAQIEVYNGFCTDLERTWNVLSQYGCVWGRCHCGLLVCLLQDKGLVLIQFTGKHRQNAEKQAAPEGKSSQISASCYGPDNSAEMNVPTRRATVYPKALRITLRVGVINVFSLCVCVCVVFALALSRSNRALTCCVWLTHTHKSIRHSALVIF